MPKVALKIIYKLLEVCCVLSLFPELNLKSPIIKIQRSFKMSAIKQECLTEAYAEKTVLEKFINIPGLHHIAENIFLNLNYQRLEACKSVKGSFQHYLDQLMANPLFFLKKFIRGGMSKKNKMDWTEIIQMTRGTNVREIILLYFKLYFKNDRVVDFDVPCYLKKDNLEKYSEIIKKVEDRNLSIVSIHYYFDKIAKILDPLAKVPDRYSEIYEREDKSIITFLAAGYGHIEIVQILAPLTDNNNAPFWGGYTPIHWAALEGYKEIVKILAPLMDNPNAPNINGETPIYIAAWFGQTEIVKTLAPLTDYPNAPNNDGMTPSSVTDNTEIKRLLENSKRTNIHQQRY